MLFKILRGNEANLPQTLTDGYCYFLKDKHDFYCDFTDDNGNLTRAKLSAEYAEKLRYIEDGATVEIDPTDISTKTYVNSQIDVHDTNATAHNDIRQIIATMGYEDVGIYVGEAEPADAVDGDIWFDLASESVPNGDEVSY